ncbi:hypothetical protein [Holzapfeliella floricola]|uniref:Uncharacterized protein n=1 Tax=Holzapfeliella floricola DSM 23037 = JCM 16512 TaxID=1423744 RepID=A0A0R2DHN0_9LACO|nr:hypothetical protein [Holzapfeliella floricola]KRN03602.1 hypothetical protein FC86_GL000708 [Holzapfeliella floricola DSM 23037 = JCM 16512]
MKTRKEYQKEIKKRQQNAEGDKGLSNKELENRIDTDKLKEQEKKVRRLKKKLNIAILSVSALIILTILVLIYL